MEYKINTNSKILQITSNVKITEVIDLIETLSNAKIIDETWILATEPAFHYTYPTLLGTCNGNCGTGCTCKQPTITTTN